MNKEELMKDLTNLLRQRHNLDGAINYITGKISKIDRLKKEESERLKEAEE